MVVIALVVSASKNDEMKQERKTEIKKKEQTFFQARSFSYVGLLHFWSCGRE